MKALLEEARASADQAVMPLHLREAPPPGIDNLRALLTPIRSGMIVTRADLVRGARSMDVGVGVGDRQTLLRALVGQDPEGTMRWLADEARRWPSGTRASHVISGRLQNSGNNALRQPRNCCVVAPRTTRCPAPDGRFQARDPVSDPTSYWRRLWAGEKVAHLRRHAGQLQLNAAPARSFAHDSTARSPVNRSSCACDKSRITRRTAGDSCRSGLPISGSRRSARRLKSRHEHGRLLSLSTATSRSSLKVRIARAVLVLAR
jgi:hypothetical protein